MHCQDFPPPVEQNHDDKDDNLDAHDDDDHDGEDDRNDGGVNDDR